MSYDYLNAPCLRRCFHRRVGKLRQRGQYKRGLLQKATLFAKKPQLLLKRPFLAKYAILDDPWVRRFSKQNRWKVVVL